MWIHELASSLAAFLLLAFLVGCAPSRPVDVDYDPSEDVTTYKTSVPLAELRAGGSYGSEASFRLQVLSGCSGEECVPEEVMLVFQASGARNLRMEDRTVVLNVDGAQFRTRAGQEEIATTIYEVDQVSGRVASLRLTFEDFQRLAEAKKVTGKLGSSGFRLSYARRSPFRALVQQVQEGPPTS